MWDACTGDPLTPEERAAFEEDVISFCDRELDLLGDIEGLDVLYAGGSSLLWLEGLSQRIGEEGSLTALDIDAGRVEEAREFLDEASLAAPVHVVQGDVFRPPFPSGAFDLAYSAGLFHELDVLAEPARNALASLASRVRLGGRIATSDFVDTMDAAQLEDEELERELAREVSGAKLYGVGPPEHLVALHEELLAKVRWRVSSPYPIRHLDAAFLAKEDPENLWRLPTEKRRRLHGLRQALRERVRREGYSRPATLYVEGVVRD